MIVFRRKLQKLRVRSDGNGLLLPPRQSSNPPESQVLVEAQRSGARNSRQIQWFCISEKKTFRLSLLQSSPTKPVRAIGNKDWRRVNVRRASRAIPKRERRRNPPWTKNFERWSTTTRVSWCSFRPTRRPSAANGSIRCAASETVQCTTRSELPTAEWEDGSAAEQPQLYELDTRSPVCSCAHATRYIRARVDSGAKNQLPEFARLSRSEANSSVFVYHQ